MRAVILPLVCWDECKKGLGRFSSRLWQYNNRVTAISNKSTGLPRFDDIERDVLYHTTDLLSVVDTNYDYVYVNQAYARFWDRPVEDFIGQSAESLLGSDLFHSRLKPNLDRCLAGEVIDLEVELVQSANNYYFEATFTPYREPNGNIKGIFVCARNIHDKKRQERDVYRRLLGLNMAIDTADLGFWRLDLATEKLHWNDKQLNIYGLSADEFDGEIDTWRSFLHPDDIAIVDQNFTEITSPNGVTRIEFRIIRADGGIRYLHSSGCALYNNKGEKYELIGINYDVTDFYLSENRYRTLVESAPISIHQVDASGNVISMNQAGLAMINAVDEKNILGTPYIDSVWEGDRDRVAKLMAMAFNGEMTEFEFRGGTDAEYSSSFVPIAGREGRITRLLGLTQDVTDRNQAKRELQFRASHDVLTGLINRFEFEQRLERLLANTSMASDDHALCFMDLDQFKIVNDTCGHAAGDELLRQLGAVLQETVRGRDTLARLGGDEFGILMEHCTLQQARRVVSAVQHAVDEFQFIWNEKVFHIGISIGLVAIDDKALDATEILKRADAACYMAKDLGRNQLRIYRPEDIEMEKRRDEMGWVSIINSALENDDFELYAQQIASLDSNQDKHYELLLRMTGKDGTIIAPSCFLPSAERYSLMPKIDEWVIHNSFKLCYRNKIFLDSIGFISINLSGPSLSSSTILDQIITELNEFDIDPEKICFEITETSAIDNLSATMKFISSLRGLGCRFALDDFGTGSSSFSYLKNFRLDFIKIDGSFVRNITTDRFDHAMVKSINEVGHIMGLKTIAEYVENDDISQALRAIGVDYAQGYAIDKPKPLKHLLELSSSEGMLPPDELTVAQ